MVHGMGLYGHKKGTKMKKIIVSSVVALLALGSIAHAATTPLPDTSGGHPNNGRETGKTGEVG